MDVCSDFFVIMRFSDQALWLVLLSREVTSLSSERITFCWPVGLFCRIYLLGKYNVCRSQSPRGPRRRSAAARLLGLRVRFPPGAWMPVSCECCCCQVEVSALDRSLVQRSPTECGVSQCDREVSILRRLWPTRGCCAI